MKHKKSFTIIETIIVVMVIGVMSALTLAKYNDFTENNKLNSDAGKLVDVLELARKRTVSGEIPTSVTCNAFNGYGIINIDTTSYKLQLCCDFTCSTVQDLNIYKLETTNFLTANPNIKFAPLTGRLHLPETLTLTIKNNIINQCISIEITYTGLITQKSKVGC